MKILHFTLGLGSGGRERRMIQLIRGLYHQCDCEQMIVTLDDHCDYPEIWETPIKVKKINYRPRKAFKLEMEEIICDFKPDILHSWVGSKQDLLILPLLKKKYHFKYVAGHIANCNPILFANYICSIPSYISADAIISNSRQGLVAQKANRGNAYVIHNGFDFSRLNNINSQTKRKELKIPEGAFIVSMCARFHPSKDWNSYIKLAKLAQEEFSNVFFLAIGDGETISYYKNLSNKYGLQNLSFLGRRIDVEEILQISDAFILFTNNKIHAEGISNSLMEAMAAGLPTIATEGGGTPELITDKINGFIIPNGDYNRAWDIIKLLLENSALKKKIGESAKEHIKKNFSLQYMTNQYIEVYRKILK